MAISSPAAPISLFRSCCRRKSSRVVGFGDTDEGTYYAKSVKRSVSTVRPWPCLNTSRKVVRGGVLHDPARAHVEDPCPKGLTEAPHQTAFEPHPSAIRGTEMYAHQESSDVCRFQE